MGGIYSVTELTRAVKNLLEGQFPFVWVQGQVTNLSRPASGHLYFSLRDDDASIACVWFKRSQHEEESFDPLTGEVFADGPKPGLAAGLENGQEVICAGRLSVYPPRGNYQVIVEFMQEAGKGRLQLEFELLKAELAALGYFDPDRKMKVPPRPRRVALVTSPRGAAVYDFLRIAAGRGLPAEIRIHPSLVQGDEAPASIAKAIEEANDESWAEVIVLIRGGGSLEDLWAFNSREVARAIFNSTVPVLSGVGHEVDVTLADLTADLRAATPSHAAQLLWKERRELAQELDEIELGISSAMREALRQREQLLLGFERTLRLASPVGIMERSALALESAARRLYSAMQRKMDAVENEFARLELRLSALDPKLPLARGYALVERMDGSFVLSEKDVRPGEALNLHLVDGTVPVVVDEQKLT